LGRLFADSAIRNPQIDEVNFFEWTGKSRMARHEFWNYFLTSKKCHTEPPAQLRREKRTEINNRALMNHFYPEIIPFPAYSRPEFHGQLH
jgi:hypothetical protein